MVNVIVYDDEGNKIVREQTPEDIPTPLTPEELDAIADQLADEVLQQSKDAMRVMGETLAEVIWRVSNGTVPQNMTEAQAKTWVRDTFREKYRALLG